MAYYTAALYLIERGRLGDSYAAPRRSTSSCCTGASWNKRLADACHSGDLRTGTGERFGRQTAAACAPRNRLCGGRASYRQNYDKAAGALRRDLSRHPRLHAVLSD